MSMDFEIVSKNGVVEIPPITMDSTSVSEWEITKEAIKKRVWALLGDMPEPVPVNPVINDVVDEGSYTRIHLTYSSYDEDIVTAYLLKPNDLETGKKYPAIIAMHPTAAEGKDVSAGLCGKPGRQYGKELVERGYIVLVPDIFAAGERIPAGGKDYETEFFYDRYPDWSAMGKMLYDHMQGVDYLAALVEVDSSKIGAIGHSLGGHNAFLLAAFDERIKASVSSCGLTSIIDDPDVFRWSRKEWFVYFKTLKDYFCKGYSPFEFHEILALIAPRAFFNWTAKDDHIFPHWKGVPEIEKRVKEVYRVYGAESEMCFELGTGGHNFPDDIRVKAYEFLDKRLK